MWFKFTLVALIALVGSVSCFSESRVVNGTATDVTKHPYIVSLRNTAGSHSCGGSIVNQRWILTAAHCVYGSSVNLINIEYATTKINTLGKNVVGVKSIVVHEGYDPAKAYANDIAMLKLADPLVYNYRTVAPVTLPDSFFEVSQTTQGSPGVLIGWGKDATGGYIQSHLQEVGLKIYSDKDCNSKHNGITTSHHICAGGDEGGKGQCNGDSGGPLFYSNSSIQVGIVSWSIKPCTAAPYPGVYTKVSHYIDWINNRMKLV